MQTTLRDYATFLSALLHSKPLGIPATGLIFNRQIAIHSAHEFPSLDEETSAASDTIGLSYGLGWGLYFSPHGKAFFKEGHDEGWRHLALVFREHGDGILILTNSSNGEGIFKPLIDALLGPTDFPFEWENYTPYDRLPPRPRLKDHKPVALTAAELSRVAGKYALSPDVVLTVTVEDGHLLVQEGDEPKQEYLPENANDFYSTTSSDECSFKPSDPSTAQILVLHLEGKDVELKRIP
jgi:CubicO group peptidase (beta-lactamase class C family)